MPVYEYDCLVCGPFSESRWMSASALPAPCPTCGRRSPRVLSAPAIGSRRSDRRSRQASGPTLVRRAREHEHEPQKPTNTLAGGRPWMIGH